MSDPMPAVRKILGMPPETTPRLWDGGGWAPRTPEPDGDDVLAERIIADAGSGVTLHELVCRGIRTGRTL